MIINSHYTNKKEETKKNNNTTHKTNKQTNVRRGKLKIKKMRQMFVLKPKSKWTYFKLYSVDRIWIGFGLKN